MVDFHDDVLTVADLIGQWRGRLEVAAGNHPAVAFDGRVALPAWLVESAKDQAERVFMELDATSVEARDLGEAERLVKDAGLEVLLAWQLTMDTFGAGHEPWAAEAANAAAQAYVERLDELSPNIHQGGQG